MYYLTKADYTYFIYNRSLALIYIGAIVTLYPYQEEHVLEYMLQCDMQQLLIRFLEVWEKLKSHFKEYMLLSPGLQNLFHSRYCMWNDIKLAILWKQHKQ